MVRLVFRPYTQVRRAICTSAPLRASTRVSSGFTLLRHSSPSFGSQHRCSFSNLSQKIKVGRWCTPPHNGAALPPIHFHSAQGFATRALAPMLDSLVRVSRRVGERHFVCAAAGRRAGPIQNPREKRTYFRPPAHTASTPSTRAAAR